MKKPFPVWVVFLCYAFFYALTSGAQIPAAYQVGTWKNFKPAAISYTFDDNTSNQIPVAIPLLNTYGFKSTIFAVTQNLNPNWNNMKTAANAGHEIGSHTVTHNNLNGAAIATQDAELKNSQATINSNITTQKCYTVAYPNCNIGDVATIQKYYIAGRICSGQIIPSSPTDFYNLSSIICGNTGVNTAADMNTRVGNAKSSGGWCVFLIHGIDNDGGYSPLASSVLSSHLSYVNTNTADYWVGTFGNVTKYIKERNAMSITETTITADSLRMTPTDNLDNTIYDAAVTIRRQLPSGWTTVRVMQAGSIVPSTIVTVNTVKYVQFDVVPDKGAYTLANASSTNPGCTTVAPTVSAVSYTQGAAATALTATGTALKWYGTNATGGTSSTSAPVPATTAAGTTTYYVSQTLNSCEGPRAAIVVTVTASGTGVTSCNETGQGAYYTGTYRNMFKELLNKTDAEVNAKVNAAFQQIFYGTATQKLYYEVGTDMAYVLDVNNNDVRTEGMSYGMMICLQLDKQAEFNKIWKWAKTYMQYGTSSPYNGYFAWQCNTNGTIKGNGPASDGEAYFITALLFAENRWGNGTGINNYGAEAQDILVKISNKTGAGSVYNLFNTTSKLITFVPYGDSYSYTDPSYQLPGFWELWARWSDTNTAFWQQTPDASRKLIRDASHPTSGLTADYSNFDGTPKTTTFNSDSHRFMYDAWRTIMNLGMDYHWFQADAQQPVIAERYLTFFKNQGTSYKNHYDWNGSNAGGDHSVGLIACNAVASLAVNNTTLTTPFVQEFWNVAIPTGTYRYYDGMLYMLGLLNCSGNFKVWKPECPNACTTPAPTVAAAVINYDLNASATTLTATGTSLKWYTSATGGTALTAAPTPATSVAGTTVYYVGQTLNGCEGPRVSVTVNVVNNYKIYKVSAPVAVDGTVDDVWNNANVLPAAATKLLSGTVTNSADLSGNFKVLWDDTYLYILADVTDDVKVNESTNAYDDDGIEVYIDINNDKATTYGANDVQYTFGWNDGTTVGVLPAGRSTTGITYTAVARTGGYIIEARIPWATLQASPAAGQLVGIDFMINDDDDTGVRDGKLAWNAATDNAWQDPSLFGTAILQGLVACTTPAAPAVTATASYCQNAAATPLAATGTGLKWYDAATGGTSAASVTPVTAATGTINYYVSQTVSGCESPRAMIAVTVNALPSATVTTGSATTFCNGGSVTLTASTGTSYKWMNGTTQVGSAATYAAATSGSYTVEVTNAATCKATSTATVVTVNAAPAAPAVTATAAYCQNAVATPLTATGTGLKWYDAATGGTAAASVTPVTTSTGTINYYVSQTTNGCESPRVMIAVTVNALPTAMITAGASTTFCPGGSVTLTASIGTSYKWMNGTTQVGTAATYAAVTSGSYTVEVTNAATCKATSTATVVTVNVAPAAPTVTAAVAYCQNAAATPLAATGTGLKWYDAATGGTAAASVTPVTTSTGTINYYVSQTTNGCESPRVMIAVTVNALPTAMITAGASTTFCPGGSVTLTASTGTSYKWMNGSTQVGTAASYVATTAGSYTVEVTNTNNCKAVSAATVVAISALPASPTVSPSAAYCQDAPAKPLTATGAALKWYTTASGGTSAASITPSTGTIGTTNYYVSQTTNGCESARSMITVSISGPPAAPAVNTTIAYCQNATTLPLTATGTALKWYMTASSGAVLANTPVPSTDAAGTTNYYVSQTTNGCESPRAVIAVTVKISPVMPAVTAPEAYCQNAAATPLAATGTALKWYMTASGGSVSANTPTPSTDAAGTTNYYVSQTANGCESPRALITVTVNALPEATITVTGSTTIVQGGSVLLNANTGTGLTYKWFKGTSQVSTDASYTATSEGSYSVEVTNSSGCKATSPVTTVTEATNQPSVITITSPVTNTTVSSPVTITVDVSDPDGSIVLVEYMDGNTVIGTGTSEPYSFTWNDPLAGSHTITVRVTDSQGGVTTSSAVTIFTGVATGVASGNTIYSNVYPVPAKDQVMIETEFDLSEATFKIVNIIGEEISLPMDINGTDAKLYVNELPDGTYILIINHNTNVITKKISVIK